MMCGCTDLRPALRQPVPIVSCFRVFSRVPALVSCAARLSLLLLHLFPRPLPPTSPTLPFAPLCDTAVVCPSFIERSHRFHSLLPTLIHSLHLVASCRPYKLSCIPRESRNCPPTSQPTFLAAIQRPWTPPPLSPYIFHLGPNTLITSLLPHSPPSIWSTTTDCRTTCAASATGRRRRRRRRRT